MNPSIEIRHIFGFLLIAFIEFFITCATYAWNLGVPLFSNLHASPHFFFWFYSIVGVVSLVLLINLAAFLVCKRLAAPSVHEAIKANFYQLTLTGGLIALSSAGTVNFSVMFFYNYFQDREFKLPTPEDLGDASPWVTVVICTALSLFEEFGKMFGLFFTFRKLVLVPFHEYFASSHAAKFPSERTLFFVGAACVGAGFCVFENFLYFAMVVLEKSRDYRIVSWPDFHGICLVRTVQSVHIVWAMISAVFFLAQGEGADDGRMVWNFRLIRVMKAIGLSWFLHAAFNITAIFINDATETRPTLFWALAFAAFNFLALRFVSRRYFRKLQASSKASLRDSEETRPSISSSLVEEQ